MKIAFVGAVEGSAIGLGSLIRANMPPGLVLTLPIEAASRHSDFVDLEPLARTGGGELLRVADINGEAAFGALRAFGPDLILVIGWSQICRAPLRSLARLGAVGFHPAALPRLRGRAVIPWTILLGESETGASLFWLDDGIDSGPILLQERIQVAPDETARSLYTKQTKALARLLPRAVELVRAGDPPRIPQDENRAVYCSKRTAADGKIDWRESAGSVVRLVRAVGDPYPGAFTGTRAGQLIVDEASVFPDSNRYVGLPGQIQSHTPDGFIVRCGDGRCVHVTAWRLNGGRERPRVHEKLEGSA